MKSTGAVVKTEVALQPQSSGAGAVNGIGIDMKGVRSAVFTGIRGAVTGGPSAYTIDWKIQESDDNISFSDISGLTVQTVGDLSVDYDSDEIDVEMELDITDYTYRYLRMVGTLAFTGGAGPTCIVAGSVTKGELIKSE